MRPGPGGCDEIRHALGVYVLGSIDPAERTVVDRHIATCPACRDELAGLAGLPALLGRLTVPEVESLGPDDGTRGAEAEAAESQAGESQAAEPAIGPAAGPLPGPPPALLRSILSEAARLRARRRHAAVLAVAAAAVVLAGAGTAVRVWTAGNGGPARAPHTATASGWQHQVSATNKATDVTATVRFSATTWGTAVDASVYGVRYGTRCVLWATDSTGRHMEIASWTYAAEGTWYPGSSSVSASAVKSFDITSNGRTLVSVPVSLPGRE